MKFLLFLWICLMRQSAADYVSDTGDNVIDCQSLDFVKTANRSLTALASFSESGVTRVRHIIEQITGLYTGSRDHTTQAKMQFKAEMVDDDSVIVVNTHETGQWPSDTPGSIHYNKAVIFVQSSQQSIADHLTRKHYLLLRLVQDDAFKDYRGVLMHDTVYETSREYEKFYMTWRLRFKGDKFILYEDDLVGRPRDTIRRLSSYLTGITLSDDIYTCIEKSYLGVPVGSKPESILYPNWRNAVKEAKTSYLNVKNKFEFVRV